MNDYTAATYGDKIAEVYDEMYPMRANVAPTVDALAQFANGGAALELGIGTGRVALPLAERGVEVHGIDASEAIVAKMRAKPGGDAIPVTISDFSQFSLVEVQLRQEILAGLCRLQHPVSGDLAGGAGAVLPQRGGAPHR